MGKKKVSHTSSVANGSIFNYLEMRIQINYLSSYSALIWPSLKSLWHLFALQILRYVKTIILCSFQTRLQIVNVTTLCSVVVFSISFSLTFHFVSLILDNRDFIIACHSQNPDSAFFMIISASHR